MRVAIIGGGFAGTACAYFLKAYGHEPIILEAGSSLALGASGNPAALYNPRLSAQKCSKSEFYTAAYKLALQTFETLSKQYDIGWKPFGALHLVCEEKKARRFPKTIESWGWDESQMRMLSAQEATEISGINLTHKALYLPNAGAINSGKLCTAYADGIEVHFGAKIDKISDIKADAVILASAMGCLEFEEASHLPLQAVRGQITLAQKTIGHKVHDLRCALCYGGYTVPSISGVYIIGSTFQPWLDHSRIIAQDDHDNIAKLAQCIPELAVGLSVVGQRASIRTAAKDRFPIVGKLDGIKKDIYISTAHGSHGLLSSLMGAHLLADLISKKESILPETVIQNLSPARFDNYRDL